MSIKKINRYLRTILNKFDLFPTNQFIKYNKKSQFTTATGGFVSLVIIILVLILFSSRGLDTANRTIITSAASETINAEPPLVNVVSGPQGGFMFAVGVYGLNLNDPNVTYFKISLYQNVFSPIFQTISSVEIPLVKCTSAHFNFNKDILSLYNNLDLRYSLCPPLGQTFQIGGRVTSQIYKQMSINVLPCNSTTTANCANSSILSAAQAALGGIFTLSFPVISTIVNANNQNYLQTYLQDRNYFYFSQTLGVRASAFIEQYTIDTDVSIMPYSAQNLEYVTAIPELFTSQNIEIGSSGLYAQISFSKSSRTTTFTRSFNKIDTFFSYIGGFLGSALGVFFLLKSYSEKAFLMDLGSRILVNEREQLSLKRFNFFHNIGIIVKEGLQKICIKFSWQRGEYYVKSMQEMDEQLDVCLIMKKLTFLEQAISTIFSDHQLEALYLKDKNTLAHIQEIRKKLNLSNVLAHANKKQQTNIEMISEDAMSSELLNSNNKDAFDRIRNNLIEVIKESKHQDKISARIVNKIDKATLQRAGIMDVSSCPIAEEKQTKEVGAKNREVKRNAVANQFEPPQKQIVAFEYIEDQD